MQLEKRQRSQKLFEPHDCPASKKEKIIAQRYFPKTCNLRFEKDFFGKEIRLGAALGQVRRTILIKNLNNLCENF